MLPEEVLQVNLMLCAGEVIIARGLLHTYNVKDR